MERDSQLDDRCRESESLFILELEERLEFGHSGILDFTFDMNSGCVNGACSSKNNSLNCTNGTCG
jgi:hypothetical protein